jgi:dienelactone hydrolase
VDAPSDFEVDRNEPLGLWLAASSPPPGHRDLRALAFEFSSRGDRVPGRLLLPPAGDGPFPLVLLQHGARGAKDVDYMDAVAGPWARNGLAVASIDLPLHGERGSTKAAGELLAGLGLEGEPGPEARQLVVEFHRQAVIDLRRALDALERVPEVDTGRAAYAGLSLGSIVGAAFLGCDPRPRAAALALAGGGFGGSRIDPAGHVGRFAPRPLLFVNATRDETVPRTATEALYAAAGEPKEILWFDAGHRTLPGAAFKSMWLFLRRQLGLGEAAPSAG